MSDLTILVTKSQDILDNCRQIIWGFLNAKLTLEQQQQLPLTNLRQVNHSHLSRNVWKFGGATWKKLFLSKFSSIVTF